MINSTYSFKWPEILWTKGRETLRARCYFSKLPLSGDDITIGKYALSIEQVKEQFGVLLDTWLLKKATLGPGIHLYLGTVRNRHLYLEHQFVNMVWGLEALSRKSELSLAKDVPDKQAAKGQRKLAVRLYDVLLPVAFDIDPLLLREFCKRCADLRNDLSHYGGERSPGDYDDFVQEIHPRMRVLRQLYRLVIFNIIGVEHSLLRWSMYDCRQSLESVHWLTVAGLINPEIKKNLSGPKSSQPDGK